VLSGKQEKFQFGAIMPTTFASILCNQQQAHHEHSPTSSDFQRTFQKLIDATSVLQACLPGRGKEGVYLIMPRFSSPRHKRIILVHHNTLPHVR
jgi:hypothetical protein